MNLLYFPTPADFRKWLKKNHAKETELWVGYYKKATGKPSVTWTETVEQALCFGWIDGIRKKVDEESYKVRFTPRKPNSIWSDLNKRTAKRLIEEGLMEPAGQKAFDNLKENKSGIYSFEQDKIELGSAYEKVFKKNKKAWEFFQNMAPSYKKGATWWVISAKQETTRERRLNTLIQDSENGIKIKPLRR